MQWGCCAEGAGDCAYTALAAVVGRKAKAGGPLTLRRLSIVVWFNVGWRMERWGARNLGKGLYEVMCILRVV